MANWVDFQTALQFVAGLNVALYGVPELRAPGVERERQQEADLVSLANAHRQFASAVIYRNRFAGQWTGLLRRFRIAGLSCLGVAVVETIALLRASGPWANCPASEGLAWTEIGVGILPSVALGYLNWRSRSHRAESLRLRNELAASLQRIFDQEALARQSEGLANQHVGVNGTRQ